MTVNDDFKNIMYTQKEITHQRESHSFRLGLGINKLL